MQKQHISFCCCFGITVFWAEGLNDEWIFDYKNSSILAHKASIDFCSEAINADRVNNPVGQVKLHEVIKQVGKDEIKGNLNYNRESDYWTELYSKFQYLKLKDMRAQSWSLTPWHIFNTCKQANYKLLPKNLQTHCEFQIHCKISSCITLHR